jgi:hypothetical protein
VYYAVVGDPSTTAKDFQGYPCEAISFNTVNGNVGADSIVSVYTHEMVETITDPLGNAWYFNSPCTWAGGGVEIGKLTCRSIPLIPFFHLWFSAQVMRVISIMESIPM